MNTLYFKIPYIDVLNYLKNSVSNEDLDALYSRYNIDSKEPEIEQLADIISDDDLYNLGFAFDTKKEELTDNYKYEDFDNIVEFLATEVDDLSINQLYSKYDCFNLDDLALAITDAELENLGYNKIDESLDESLDEEDTIKYLNRDYDEDFDYLEDIPFDIYFMIIDPEEGILATNNEEDFYRFKECLDSSLIEECKPCSDFVDTDMYLFKVKPKKFEVSEDVVINKNLNSSIFTEDNKMIPEVKEQLINYIEDFIQKEAVKGVIINYDDIHLVGSNAGYLYTPESDIDIHIISSDQIDVDKAESLFNDFDLFEDENPLFIGQNKVEIGIEDNYDIVSNEKDARKYSLISDEWVDNSDQNDIYTEDDLNKITGYEDIVNDYTEKINDVVDSDNFTAALTLKTEIRQNRSEDLFNYGALSVGNVVFKELRNNGAYGKLRDYILKKELELGLDNE